MEEGNFKRTSGNSIAVKEVTQKKASFSVEMTHGTNDTHESFRKFVSDMKNSLPSSVQNAKNFRQKSGNTIIDSLESSSDTSHDDSNSDFSNFISQLNENFQDQSKINYKRNGGSANSLNGASAIISEDESSDKEWSDFRTELEYDQETSDDAEGENPETERKSESETESKYNYKISERFRTPTESSTDDSDGEDFGDFISTLQANLQKNTAKQVNLSSKNLTPCKGSSKQTDSVASAGTKAKTRSHSASGRLSLDRIEPATKENMRISENTRISEFNLADAEAAAKYNFMEKRTVYGVQLYKIFNKTVFNHRLPLNMTVKWSGLMKSTAGTTFCKKKRLPDGSYEYSCLIVLSYPVVISFARLRDTLLHEMCHAAVWMINKCSDSHGPLWKTWASRVNLIYPQIEVPTRCHSYNLEFAYTLKCNSCDFEVKRHKLCPVLLRKVCPKCRHPTTLIS